MAAAEIETRESKAPCVYLGFEVSSGVLEPDVAKWPESDIEKTKTRVCFEWPHVFRDGAPHRTTFSAHDLLHHRARRVPLSPLRSCPTNLTFTLEFMQAVASNVFDGIVYKGIAYEGQHPTLLDRHLQINLMREWRAWLNPN